LPRRRSGWLPGAVAHCKQPDHTNQ
jgi:hypothetical protein